MLKKVSNFRIRPVRCANELAANDALAIDDVGFRPHVCLEEFGSRLIGVPDGDEVNMTPADKVRIRVRIFVNADRKDSEVGGIVVKLEQGR